MITEAYIQYIWKQGLYSERSLRTACGQTLEIMNPGEQNSHAGPDFFNARIRLGPLVWAGNIEVHVFASQWNIHGHHMDPAYDNVILHVIQFLDKDIKDSKGRSIPALIIDPFFMQLSVMDNMCQGAIQLPCHPYIGNISAPVLKSWFIHLYEERLNEKVQTISHIMQRYPGDREKALLIAMASGFGLPVNRLPFEMMASGLPLSLLSDIKDCLPDLEALLFRQSGLLDNPANQGPYVSSLLKRYARLKKVGVSNPLPPHLWKFLRIRPASFPTLRLSQFASLIYMHFPFYEKFMEYDALLEIDRWLKLESSSFWNTHYTFKKNSPYSVKKMGQQAILNLSLNVLIPFMEATRGSTQGCQSRIKHIRILHKLSAESNHIIKIWSIFGIEPNNALESQALIHLYNAYCKQKRCIDCQIGKINPSCNP